MIKQNKNIFVFNILLKVNYLKLILFRKQLIQHKSLIKRSQFFSE